MKVIKLAERRVERLVDELFAKENPAAQYGDNCTNPITRAGFIYGADPIEPQKMDARRALLAREWLAIHGPADAQPFPLNQYERAAWKYRGLWGYIVALYARSAGDNPQEHPPFADYVSGVLWEAGRVGGDIGILPNYPDELPELTKRFPPRALAGWDLAFVGCHPISTNK